MLSHFEDGLMLALLKGAPYALASLLGQSVLLLEHLLRFKEANHGDSGEHPLEQPLERQTLQKGRKFRDA